MTGAGGQIELPFGPVHNLRLFSEHSLEDRLPGWPEFRAIPVEALRGAASALACGAFRTRYGQRGPDQERFVKPVLRALGFAYTVQADVPSASGRRQPDYASFLDDGRRAEADGLSGIAMLQFPGGETDPLSPS